MIKKLLLVAVLLVPGLAYANNPSANLSVQIVPANSGGGLPGSILPPCPGGCTWTLAFDDEFNGASLDMTKWLQPYSDGSREGSFPAPTVTDCFGNNGTPSPGSVSVGGGLLIMNPVGTASVGNNPSYACEVAPRQKLGPGYFEARLKTDPSQWTDFWTCCDQQRGSTSGWFEVDIMETLPGYTPGAGYIGNIQADSYHGFVAGQPTGDMSSAFHVYGVDWEANSGYFLYVDGQPVPQSWGTNPDGCSAASPCNNPTYLRFMAGLFFPGSPRNGFQIDWFRYYTHP